ncbi:MAG: hypothetical protein AAFR74_01375 [Pseudomonadota bacterium]
MRMLSKLLAVVAIGGLAGCASIPVEEGRAPVGQMRANAELPPSGLGPQTLAPGECGLFLWSKTDTTKFIFFSRAVSGIALFKPGNETLNLQQIAAGGTIFGQFNTEQGFAADDGSMVELSFVPGDELTGGQRIADGLITITDAEGWRTKLPVLGIRACMPEG